MTSMDPARTVDSGNGPSRALRAAALLVFLQALALGAVTALALVELGNGTANDTTVAVAVLGFVTAAGLVLVGRGLVGRRRWSRAPGVVVNLLVLPIAWAFLGGDWPYVGVLLGGWAIAVLWLLFTPAVREDFGE